MKKIFLLICPLCMFANQASAFDVTLGWGESAGNVTGYKIYWGPAPGDYPNSLDVGNVLQGTVTGLADDTYYFVATAYNNTEESGYSEWAFLDTLPIAAPAGYDTEVTKVGSDYQVIHSCPVATSATGYRLYQDEVVVYDGSDPSFTQTLPTGTYDFYWVAYKPKQIDSNGTILVESARSVEKTLHLTAPAIPMQPSILQVEQ